jgi:two-component system, cell cycle sensor histidine kinase and response regulator CckA
MRRQTILVVEDEQVVAMDLVATLNDLGYNVLQTEVASEAVNLALGEGPDLVLMDIRLADGDDGIATGSAIREHRDLPIIFLTAHADQATRARAGAAAPYGYLVKPFDVRTLQTTIEVVLLRHQHDRQLRAREEWFATTLASIGDGVVTTDTAGLITYLNPVALYLLAATPERVIGQPVETVVQLIAGATGRPIPHPVYEVLASGGRVTLTDDVLLRQADGTAWWVDDCVAAISLDGKQPIGAVMIFRDATARRQAEHERLKHEQRLAELVQLEQLRTLAAQVAHDMNNLLTCITGQAELSLIDRANPESVSAAIEQILASTRHATDLTRHLLSSARGSPHTTPPEVISVNMLVTNMVELLRATYFHHVAIEQHLAEPGPLIRGYLTQMQQVLLNLLINAAEAVNPPEAQILVATAEATFNDPMPMLHGQGELRPGSYATIIIADNGYGMDSAAQARIFEPFFSTKRSGRGLGLVTVLDNVRQHGGAISIQSAPGSGAVFTVWLPILTEA